MASLHVQDVEELRARLKASEDLTVEQALQIKDLKLEIKYLNNRAGQPARQAGDKHQVSFVES